MLRSAFLRVDWRVWIALGFLTAVGSYLLNLAVPDVPDYYRGNIIYPLVVGSVPPVIELVGLVSLGGAFAWLILERNTRKILFTAAMFLGCTASFCLSCTFPFSKQVRTLTDKDSILFEAHTYHLAVSYGPNGDFDVTYTRYIVYQCDTQSFYCHKYFVPDDFDLEYGPSSLDEAMQKRTSFAIDNTDHKLYLQVEAKKFLVYNNQCALPEKCPE